MKLDKIFGKSKKIDENKLLEWVKNALKKGSDMNQISNALMKKYPKKEVEQFLKKNYSIEPGAKPDKKLEAGLEKEKLKKDDKDKLNNEMDDLLSEAKEEEPEVVVATEKVTETEPETTKKPDEKGVPIQRMSTYDIELLNQVASINQGIMELIKILRK